MWIWTPRFGHQKPNLEHCRAAVRPVGRRGFGFDRHQCIRPAVLYEEERGETYGFCKQHAPSAEKRRCDANTKRWDNKVQASREKADRIKKEAAANVAAKKALEEIASGHNNPRELAAKVLAMYP